MVKMFASGRHETLYSVWFVVVSVLVSQAIPAHCGKDTGVELLLLCIFFSPGA